jgi:hemerythrin
MSLINWDNSLSVNVGIIDTQHKKLIDLINKLYDAMSQGQGATVLKDVLTNLLSYTKTHFDYEVSLLEKFQYPQVEHQKTEHSKFVQKLKDLIRQYNSGNTLITNQILVFLKDWLVSHIKVSDKKYTPYLEGKV